MTHKGWIAPVIVVASLVSVLGCGNPEAPTAPEAAPSMSVAAATTGGFHWGLATPESQGMCGSLRQLGCTKSLSQIWNNISNPKHNTKRFLVIRNDKVIFDRGGTNAYAAYSGSKGLLGAPTLVYAMSKCGVGLTDPVSTWLQAWRRGSVGHRLSLVRHNRRASGHSHQRDLRLRQFELNLSR